MKHQIVGYSRINSLAYITLEVEVSSHWKSQIFSQDDPDGIACYDITKEQAEQIAKVKKLPRHFDYTLEGTQG